MRALLLSGYDASSHRHWREIVSGGLPQWDWETYTLPPRHFSWRVRGNALYLAEEIARSPNRQRELLLATSMVDLATLKGLVPELSSLPTIVYFHENQFDYPDNASRHGLVEAQLTSLYSALAADLLLFNSDFNRQGFFAGARDLLKRLPDCVPPGVVDRLEESSAVLPVPISEVDAAPGDSDGPLQLVWNHRWEYDKGPAELLELVRGLVASEIEFCLHVVGQQFRSRPSEFEELHAVLASAGRLGQWGTIEKREDYLAVLSRSHVVLSTALHDFQGLSVLEACAAGCSPLVPARLVYPEWFAEEYLYRGPADAVARIQQLSRLRESGLPLPRADVSGFFSRQLLPEYERIIRSQLRGNSV